MRISDWSSDVCSSDLRETEHAGVEVQRRLRVPDPQHGVVEHEAGGGGVADRRDTGYGGKIVAGLGGHVENSWWRSEEHTSELQSLMRISYAVFCLKKKTE